MRLLLASLLLWVAAGALADQTAAPAEDPPVPAGEPPAPAAEPASAPPPGPPLDPRLEAYEQFRARYDTAHFDEALPFAKRVVELSEAGSDPDYELPIAYNNLGATQFQLGDYPAAEASYRKSLELLEATQGIGSRRLIVPLAGLGTVSAARDQHDLAAAFFARALAVSRRADGLFNLQQLPLIEQSANSLYALADYAGVERERTYALRIAEQNYGYGDPRTLPPLLELAKFYEGLREFIAARMMYLRARDVTMKESQGFSPEAVRALLGVARTHRLQYTMDPETLDSQQPARDEVTGDVVGKVYRESRVPPPAVDRTGLRAVRNALEMLRAVSDPPPQLLIDALTELGDWYQTTSRQGLAYPFYEEASAVFAAHPGQGLVNPLLQPRMVFYRPPVSSRRGLNTLTGQYRIRRAVFEFTVTEAGLTQDLTVVESDMNEAQLSQSRRALGRAVYAPRFEDGKAVASPGVRFTSEWTEQQQPESAPAAPAAAAGRG
ncbi:MAG: tetratricopeptide repeat protein [Steroidobacteraceae bacterium]|nr:tetratricopeptide repeat protein [Steroidobacteraceae bacterium]